MNDDQAAPVCQAKDCTRAANPVICAVDARKLGDVLAQLGAEYEQLSAAPTMQGREVGTVGGTALASQRSPGNTHVMAMRDTRLTWWNGVDHWGADDTPSVFQALHEWAAVVRESRSLTTPARLTVATERGVLVSQLDWITTQDWAGEFYDQIRQLWTLMRRANGHGSPPRRIHRLHTPCPMCGVRALTHRPGGSAVTCESCGHSQTVPELEETA